MVFSSNLFLFLFLPVCLAVYFITSKRWRNTSLFFLSSFFYFWGSGSFLINLYAVIFLNYKLGEILARVTQKQGRILLGVGIFFNLLQLLVYKYLNFFYDQLSALAHHLSWTPPTIGKVGLPVGISFFTFQAISYLVEVYQRKEKPAYHLVDFGLFLSCFPHLVAGPVVRYSDVSKELRERESSVDLIFDGIFRFSLGLAKKVVLANTLGAVADSIYGLPRTEVTLAVAWLGSVAYAFQIFYDFSGYSDMAIGLAKVFGFHFPENFNQPYQANNFTEFWRRWHMSLSLWFRDFLYIPLGGNRYSATRTYLNLFTVFALCGLWHGASWTFIVWGVYHGLLLVFERLLRQKFNFEFRGFPGQFYMFLMVTLGWVVFRSEDFSQAVFMIKKMFSLSTYPTAAYIPYPVSFYLKNNVITALGLAAAFSLFPLAWIKTVFLPKDQLQKARVQGAIAVLLSILSASYLAKGSYNPFIYFRF